MKQYLIYLIPVISGIIGWVTNYIAVKMIFRPRIPINILGFKIQGLLPKRQNQLAEKIAEIVETHLVSVNDLKKNLNNPDLRKKLNDVLNKKIEIFLNEKLTQINPMIAMFLNGELADKVKEKLFEQISELLPEFAEILVSHFDTTLNFKKMVEEKINNFDVLKLENIILSIASIELKAIEIFGGILGFLIGIIQLIIFKI
jgi:uncharacterized membrane protein YheB (UPF0754 family)